MVMHGIHKINDLRPGVFQQSFNDIVGKTARAFFLFRAEDHIRLTQDPMGL